MKKLILLVAILATTAMSAQKKVQVYGDDAYFIVTEYKTSFYFKYTPEDDMPKKLEDSGGGLLTATEIMTADASIEGEYVVLKRMKSTQQTGYRFTIPMHDLLQGKPTKRNGKVKGHIRRWTDRYISMIRQY